MVATLFYVDVLPAVGELAVLDGDDGFHAATVRRIRVGERLAFGDGAGALADCEVEHAGRDGLRARVLTRWSVAAARPPVTVAQALPKSDRSELAVELATEAGADAFLAWRAARCVTNWDLGRAEKGLRRWRAVARSAARQSRRSYIPTVDGVLSTEALARRIRDDAAGGAAVLALHESATDRLADVMSDDAVAQATAILLVVGPEGGIAPDEVAILLVNGRDAPADRRLQDGDAVSLFPLVAGG